MKSKNSTNAIVGARQVVQINEHDMISNGLKKAT